jgi:hypothetical protein
MSHTSIRHFIFIVVLMFLSSCGKSDSQKVIDGMLTANNYLTDKNCQAAIDVLEGLGRQNANSTYLKLLASAYGCRAGYSTTVFFGTDISKTTAPSPLGGITTYTTSLVSSTSPLNTDSNFEDLQTAIDILLYAGGIDSATEPTASERAKHFSLNQAGDINTELLFMMFVQTGRIMKVYGNTSVAGVKGAGSASNTCFTDYSATPSAVQTYITSGGATGACHSVSSAHTELASTVTTALLRKRLCYGVVLINSILDVLPSVVATAGGGNLNDISTLTASINTIKTTAISLDSTIAPTALVMSQYNCENDSSITNATLASYYALVFEGLVQ